MVRPIGSAVGSDAWCDAYQATRRCNSALLSVLLALSTFLNAVFVGWLLADSRYARRLEESPLAAPDKMRDCASVACPRLFTEAAPAVQTGLSTLIPLLSDTRYRLHGPKNMLDLTRLLYGSHARLGEPYQNFSNPFGRSPNLKYDWTQINEQQLEETFAMLPNEGRSARLVVEVGSFIGRSSVLIGRWLRRRELKAQHEDASKARGQSDEIGRTGIGGSSSSTGASVSLLCIDTWSGDLAMTLGQICEHCTSSIAPPAHGQPRVPRTEHPHWPQGHTLTSSCFALSSHRSSRDRQTEWTAHALPSMAAERDGGQPDRARAAAGSAFSDGRTGTRLLAP